MPPISPNQSSKFNVQGSKFSFELVCEQGRPVAALISDGLTATQIRAIYMLLPPATFNSAELATRWQLALVAASYDWAATQLRRIPCTPPKQTIKLAFL